MAAPRKAADKENSNRPVVRDYGLVAVVCLVGAFLVQFAEGLGLWALIPLLIGLLGLLVQWGSGPAVYLIAMTVLVLMSNVLTGNPTWFRPEASILADILMATCVLGYVMAHMRLLTLANHALPPDRRRQRRPQGRRMTGRWLLPGGPTRRTTERGYAGELLQMLAGLPLFGLVAALLWWRLTYEESPDPRRMPHPAWQMIVVLWVLALVLVVGHAFLSFLGRARASREESLLFLQDQLWTATRGEQRRIARWLTWARLRGQAKKEER